MAEQMKPSGIDWIGDIPDEWDITKVRFVTKLRSEQGFYNSDDKYIGLENISSYTGEYISTESEYDAGIYDLYKTGDLLFSKLRPYLAKALIADDCGFCTGELAVIKEYNGDIRYLFYYMLSDGFLKMVDASTYGAKMPRASWDYIKNLQIPVIGKAEQQAIADFLDKECGQIDSIAADLEKQIALLQQYKKSLITETVTKGLDKSVPMKDSGVEWIGEIPNTWDCKKMKYVISEPLQYGANEAGDDYKEDYPRYIRITDITEENSLKDDGKLSLSPDIAKPYLLKDGDLLFARSGATVGKTFYYTSNYGTCAFAGYLIKARFNQDKMNPKFVYYTTLGIGYENWKNTVFTQATIQNIGADKYAQLYITVPSMKEQNEIIAYLDTQCKAIDDVIHSKYQQLSTIQEHKKSLIYEYVTGKKTSEGGAVRWPSKQGN